MYINNKLEYRVWDEDNFKMCIVDSIHFPFPKGSGKGISCKDSWIYPPYEYGEEYTGHLMKNLNFKDKNGVDVFEGDIIQAGDLIGTIVWSNECVGYHVVKLGDDLYDESGSSYSFPTMRERGIEVIGNMFEGIVDFKVELSRILHKKITCKPGNIIIFDDVYYFDDEDIRVEVNDTEIKVTPNDDDIKTLIIEQLKELFDKYPDDIKYNFVVNDQCSFFDIVYKGKGTNMGNIEDDRIKEIEYNDNKLLSRMTDFLKDNDKHILFIINNSYNEISKQTFVEYGINIENIIINNYSLFDDLDRDVVVERYNSLFENILSHQEIDSYNIVCFINLNKIDEYNNIKNSLNIPKLPNIKTFVRCLEYGDIVNACSIYTKRDCDTHQLPNRYIEIKY